MLKKSFSMIVLVLLLAAISTQVFAEAQLTAIVNTKSDPLNLWDAPAGSTSKARIPKGETVVVLEKGVEWSKVSYKNKTGYVQSKYLSYSSVETSTTNTGTNDALKKGI